MAVATHLKIDIDEYDTRIRTFIPYYEEMLDAAVEALPAAGRTIETVAALMVDRNFHTLPVVDEGTLVGVVGQSDVLGTIAARD